MSLSRPPPPVIRDHAQTLTNRPSQDAMGGDAQAEHQLPRPTTLSQVQRAQQSLCCRVPLCLLEGKPSIQQTELVRPRKRA